MKKNSIGILILALLVPLLVGAVSSALSARGMAMYMSLLDTGQKVVQYLYYQTYILMMKTIN